MPLIDYFIFVLGCSGIGHYISNSSLRDFIKNKLTKTNSLFLIYIYYLLTNKPFSCWPCATFWSSAFIVNFYFVNEIFLTKVLICFTNYLLVWFVLMVNGEE